MRVLLVTTWGIACGIAEHSAMLKGAVEMADSNIDLIPDPHALNPLTLGLDGIDLVHLNYHDALHSRWTPDRIHELQQLGLKVLVTYHDTGVPNSERCRQIIRTADAAVVHEPFTDLPADKTHYWRMGVPTWQWPMQLPCKDGRPVLGTVGFPFGWKCYDKLAELTAALGWGLLLIAPGAQPDQVLGWQAQQPHLIVRTDFVLQAEAVSLLAGCDATAFTYVTHNTGQSGAILLGIAARKPVIALSTCRQFRALYEDPIGNAAIHWAEDFDDVATTLKYLPIQRCDPAVVALAEQDSWEQLGAKYAALYRRLVGEGEATA